MKCQGSVGRIRDPFDRRHAPDIEDENAERCNRRCDRVVQRPDRCASCEGIRDPFDERA